MNLNKAKKIITTENKKEREQAFFTLYGVESQTEILKQFESKVAYLKVEPITNRRLSKKNLQLQNDAKYQEQYIKLLELILEYSHAIFFLYSKDRVTKNITAYRRVALRVIREDNVKKAFGFMKRLRNYKEPQDEEPKSEEPKKIIIDSECLALEHIESLKSNLESDLKVMGGSVEDKRAYMKFAIISLATGAIAKEITDKSYHPCDNEVIYDKEYINKLVDEVREYQEIRTVGKKNNKKLSPLSERGIRNGIDKLQLPLSVKLKEKLGDKGTHCRNFNHLTFLYNECITTKTPKQAI